MSKAIDPDAFDPARVRVVPPVEDLEVRARGSWIELRGRTSPGTAYEVTLDAGLRAADSQSLGAPQSLSIDVGEARPALLADDGHLRVIDASGPLQWPLRSINVKRLKVR